MAQFSSKNKASRVARRWFTDFDINMTLHPESNDLALKYDIVAIKRSVRNLLLTNLYERPFKPGLGVNLRGMLFELDTTDKQVLKEEISSLITVFEPRVSVNNVTIVSRGNALHANLDFSIVNNPRPYSLDLILQRTR